MKQQTQSQEKATICNNITAFLKRMCDKGLTTCLGGNISCKLGNSIFITPSGIDKFCLSSSDIIEMDLDGNIIRATTTLKPSIESAMHIEIYKQRTDVFAIIHSHSFYSSLFSVIDKKINVRFTAESAKNIGIVGLAEYATMGTVKLAHNVSAVAVNHNVVLMKNHGILTVGKDLLEAFYRLEIIEQTAKLTYHSHGFDFQEVPQPDLDKYLSNNKHINEL